METLYTLDPVVNLHEELEPDNDSDNHNDLEKDNDNDSDNNAINLICKV